ncbi:MAG: hypothetical protein ACFE0Q_11445 [Anaerolineae bacterium]
MPLNHQSYTDKLFICNLYDRVNEEDARRWAELGKAYADREQYPLIALLDLQQVTYVTAIARRIFARASDRDHLHIVAVATSDFVVEQNMRLTAMMSASKCLYVFTSWQDAQQHARHHAHLLNENLSWR